MNLRRALSVTIFGCIVGLLIQAPSLLLALRSSGFEPAVLSDWDEAYYLPLPFEAREKATLQDALSWGDGTLRAYRALDSSLPHALTDVVVGSLAIRLDLSPLTLGMALDLFLFPIVLTIFCAAYFSITRDMVVALIAATTTLLYPWVGALSAFRMFELSWSPHIQTIAHNFFPSVPIFRAIYTQVSYPLFALFFLILSREYLAPQLRYRWTFSLGCIAGILIYIYFFAWGAALCLGGGIYLMMAFCRRRSVITVVRHLAVFVLTTGFVSLPGLTALFGNNTLFAPGGYIDSIPPLPYNDFWFLSPISLVALAIALFVAYRTRSIFAVLVAVLVLAEHALMNVQPLLNRWLTPYHFPLFYLHPLLSGVLMISVAQRFSRRSRQIILASLIAVACALPWRSYLTTVRGDGAHSTEVLRALSSLPGRQNIASIPYDHAFDPGHKRLEYLLFPYWIKTFTQHESFSQFMSFSERRRDLVERELLLGYLYLGTPQLVGWCPDPKTPLRLDDLLQGAESFHEHQRRIDCAIAASLLPVDGCELLRRFKVTHVVDSEYRVAPVVPCPADDEVSEPR